MYQKVINTSFPSGFFFFVLMVMSLSMHLPVLGQEPPTFLYRISGNGISNPSYLLGTVHLSDKKLFNFQDSLYSYLLKCEVFAMELDPDSLTYGVVNRSLTNRKERVLLRNQVSSDALKRIKNKYQHLVKEPIEQVSLGELLNSAQQKFLQSGNGDNMPAFMDMYLMGKASDYGKPVVGLESFETQMKMLELITEGKDPEKVLDVMVNKKLTLSKLQEAYASGNMNALVKMISAYPPEIEMPLLSSRNKQMVVKIDSLVKRQSVFVAVGAAHLPGKTGLVQLLRQRGYILTPELSVSRTHAGDFAWPEMSRSKQWYLVAEKKDGYQLSFPGNPTRNSLPQNGVEMLTFVNWETTESYFSTYYASPFTITESNRDSLMREILENSRNGMKARELKAMESYERDGNKGFDYHIVINGNLYYRIVLLQDGQDINMLMVGSSNEAFLKSNNAERFFASFKRTQRVAPVLEKYTNDSLGFSMLMPPGVTITYVPNENPDISVQQVTGRLRGHEIVVVSSKANFTYQLDDDTLIIHNVVNALKEKFINKAYSRKLSHKDGYPVTEIDGTSEDGSRLKLYSIKRGNRVLNILIGAATVSFNEGLADSVIASFGFLPYKEAGLTAVETNGLRLYTSDQKYIAVEKDDVTGADNIVVFHDGLPANMQVSSRKISPFAWSSSDTAYLKFVLEEKALEEKATPVNRKAFFHFGSPAAEAYWQVKGTHQVKRVRLVKAGNTIYHFSMLLDPKALRMQSVNAMFDSAFIAKEHAPFDLKRNSAETIFEEMQKASPDSLRKLMWQFGELPFTKADMSFLVSKAIKRLSFDTLGLPNIQRMLWKRISQLADSSHSQLLLEAYHASDKKSDAPGGILTALARINTAESIGFIKEILVSNSSYHDISEPMRMIAKSQKGVSLLLPALWKDLQQLERGVAVLFLYNTAVDSGWKVTLPDHFEDLVFGLSQKMADYLSSGKEEYFGFPFPFELITTLQRLRSKEANDYLNVIAAKAVSNNYFRMEAVMALVQNGEIPDALLDSLASFPFLRSEVYENLKKYGSVAHFPKRFNNQASLAEAYLNDAFDDDFPDEIVPQGNMVALFEGSPHLFYLYRVGFKYEDKWEYYLGVSGPFHPKNGGLELEDKLTNVSGITSLTFDKKRLEKLLLEYLADYGPPPGIERIELK